MAIFTMSDLHLSLGTNKSMEVFGGWENYVERIEKNWQRLVSPDDTVIVGGDISWGIDFKQAEPDFRFLNALNGRKLLLKGNHDYWWDTMAKNEKFLAENGFNTISFVFNNCCKIGDYAVCGTRGWINERQEATPDKKVLLREAGRLRMSIEAAVKQGLVPIVFLHYPPIFINERNDEIMDVLHEYDIKRCYYGHIHGATGHKFALRGQAEGISFELVSADYLKFIPLDITEAFR